jgi:hypothetical protein
MGARNWTFWERTLVVVVLSLIEVCSADPPVFNKRPNEAQGDPNQANATADGSIEILMPGASPEKVCTLSVTRLHPSTMERAIVYLS